MPTDQEIRDAIEANPAVLTLVEAGNDSGAAEALRPLLPPVIVETRLSRLGILSLYADPADGMTVLGTIDAVAQGNPVVAAIRDFMGAGVHPSCLPDWGLPSIRAALTVPVESGGLGLTEQLAAPILAAAERPPSITADDVSRAWAVNRGGN